MKNIPEDWNEQRKQLGGRRNLAAFLRFKGRVAAVAAKVRGSGKKLQKNRTFFAVLVNNLTKTHAKLCTLFLYFPL